MIDGKHPPTKFNRAQPGRGTTVPLKGAAIVTAFLIKGRIEGNKAVMDKSKDGCGFGI